MNQPPLVELSPYREVSDGISVSIEPHFLPEQSKQEMNFFCFAYRAQIQNLREEPVQLISRHWIIRDGRGVIQEVKGPGVVGLQPVIQPGQIFEYSSTCPLTTPQGSMRGWFTLLTLPEKNTLAARIPLFFLRRDSAPLGQSQPSFQQPAPQAPL